MQNLHLFEFLAKAFLCHVHHFQCFTVPMELVVMEFIFWLTVVGIVEMLV
jgi:hypothetical protein